jgi:hypothetical protein
MRRPTLLGGLGSATVAALVVVSAQAVIRGMVRGFAGLRVVGPLAVESKPAWPSVLDPHEPALTPTGLWSRLW